MFRIRRLCPAVFVSAFLCILAVCAPARAGDVKLRLSKGRVLVETPVYSAAVDENGFLTDLAAGGDVFVSPAQSASRGGYFYLDKQLCSPGKPRIQKKGTVAARGEKAALSCSFGVSSLTLRLENRTRSAMDFYIVLTGELAGVKHPDSDIAAPPVTANTGEATFYRGSHKLLVKGITRIWGPWRGNHQVIQRRLPPNGSAVLTLTFSAVTRAEGRKIEQLLRRFEIVREPLLLHSPLEWQVFQRTGLDEGGVRVSGRVAGRGPLSVEITGPTRLKKRFAGGRVSLPVGPDGSFNAVLSVPAGGWYECAVRAVVGGKEIVKKVEHVGVGEVFVGAGQSNSTNYGEKRLKVKSGMVSAFDGSAWRMADDPQPGCHDKSSRGSFWPAFGDALYARLRVPVGVAVTGHGGTSVKAWQPGGELYDWMMRRIYRLGFDGFRAVLWHQGESDVGMNSDRYAYLLANVIRSSKRDAGWEFPWFVARVSYHNPNAPSYDSTRNAQKKLWDLGVALPGPDTDTLGGDYRDRGGRGIHFSEKGLRAHGKMWADIVGDYIERILGR